MKAWDWFCQLGVEKNANIPLDFSIGKNAQLDNTEIQQLDGTEEFCTRRYGQGKCQCGSSFRSLHCIWSHYHNQ